MLVIHDAMFSVGPENAQICAWNTSADLEEFPITTPTAAATAANKIITNRESLNLNFDVVTIFWVNYCQRFFSF